MPKAQQKRTLFAVKQILHPLLDSEKTDGMYIPSSLSFSPTTSTYKSKKTWKQEASGSLYAQTIFQYNFSVFPIGTNSHL